MINQIKVYNRQTLQELNIKSFWLGVDELVIRNGFDILEVCKISSEDSVGKFKLNKYTENFMFCDKYIIAYDMPFFEFTYVDGEKNHLGYLRIKPKRLRDDCLFEVFDTKKFSFDSISVLKLFEKKFDIDITTLENTIFDYKTLGEDRYSAILDTICE